MQREGRDANEREVDQLAKKTLLKTEEIQMWLDHLYDVKKRRQAGARKAATTRRNNRYGKQGVQHQ